MEWFSYGHAGYEEKFLTTATVVQLSREVLFLSKVANPEEPECRRNLEMLVLSARKLALRMLEREGVRP